MPPFLLKFLLKFFCSSKKAMLANALVQPLLFLMPQHFMIWTILLPFYAASIPVLFGKIFRPLCYKKDDKGEYKFAWGRYFLSLFLITFIVYYILAFFSYFYAGKALCYLNEQSPF